MDMKPIWGAIAFGTLLAIALPALADVKAGVDAWQQGDYAKAIAEWRPLANAGDPDAQFNLGQAYKLGRGVPADLNSAVDWYRKATAQGHARAEDNLGLLMFQQGDRAGAMPYLQHAAARGETRAQYIVGTALFNGDMVGKDWVRAYAMMTRASASGLPQATTSLQQMDKYIPADQRKQGLALATSMEAQEKSLASASLTLPAAPAQPRPTSPTPTKPAPAPVTQVAAAKPQLAAPKPEPTPAKPAAAKPAPARTPAPAAGGDWRVQLGAFGDEGRARALWSQLTRKVSGLSGYQPYLVKAGSVTRLQAGPIASSADASRLCSSIKAAGADCMPKKN
ncbi:SPOR domain-containing protein [Sphingobium sp. WTD-1]|uniref:SPOR domain-containing protein n=1 Tax=Sphingobium sp. WTD-1 TaxID=2979467 RepID=UPI0024DEB3A4|nr:SPOR domain-containing protein [Sphingobium sp. WTD-1]WIA54080.1 SPOR domain-containing protein [Sphingobium sp. WTD-1]